MKKYTLHIVAILMMGDFAFSQQSTSEKGAATGEAIERGVVKNSVHPTQKNLSQILGLLKIYQDEQGAWPTSWSTLESKFNSPIWESVEIRDNFTRSFVLLPGVLGDIKTREEGPYSGTMMLVMASPVERELSRDRKELGRWVMWKTFRGQIVTRWHPEAEITSFSAWPKVQSVITEHIEAIEIKGSTTAKDENLNLSSLPNQKSISGKVESVDNVSSSNTASDLAVQWVVVAIGFVTLVSVLLVFFKRKITNHK